MKRKFRDSIRFKLLLVSLALLVIPWAGYRYLQETGRFLSIAQQESLQAVAQGVALLAATRAEAFPRLTPSTEEHANPNIYVHNLPAGITVDGFGDEWQNLEGQFQSYPGEGAAQFKVLAARDQHNLYLLLQIVDSNPTYWTYAAQDFRTSDWVRVAFIDPQQQRRDYLFLTAAPGPLTARPLQFSRNGPRAGPADHRVKANWQETESGYSLELRIPLSMMGSQIGIQVNDADNRRESTSSMVNTDQLGTLVGKVSTLQQLLDSHAQPNQQLWLLDAQGHVLARSGQLLLSLTSDDEIPWLLRKISALVLQVPTPIQPVTTDSDTRYLGEMASTLSDGQRASMQFLPPSADNRVFASGLPLKVNGETIGAVVVETTGATLLSLKNQALFSLVGITLMLFLIVALVLLGFATLLTSRISRLNKQVSASVTSDGRISGSISIDQSHDEIGDLSRGFASVIDRLNAYNHYLEAMSSRLSHELRTPLTIVKTSIESCGQLNHDEKLDEYLERATDGAARLEGIIQRMRESTRLEKSLEESRLEMLDMEEWLHQCVSAYGMIYPTIQFDCNVSAEDHRVRGSAELLSQALEKIIANAVDFHREGTAITLTLQKQGSQASLCVQNTGPRLPDNLDPFQSMISQRRERGDTPHLGLGLYLVSLIIAYHGGKASAHNLKSGEGVVICLSLPLVTDSG
ncbi:MAG: ATP-binding protein [bacterium]